jgi:hypothetical protein
LAFTPKGFRDFNITKNKKYNFCSIILLLLYIGSLKTTTMSDLLLLIGEIMPEELILDKLHEVLTEYKITPTKDKKQELGAMMLVWLSKQATAKHGLEKVSKDWEEATRIRERLNSEKA